VPDAPASVESAQDLAVRAAWHYYVEGLTQEQIATGLRLSRAKVVRLLQGARASGTVRIDVGAGDDEHVALERALVARYALREAIVLGDKELEQGAAARRIGQAAGAWLARQLRPGITVAVGWGETLDHAWRALPPTEVENASVVSLLGSPSLGRGVSAAEVARRLADALHAECYQLTAPVLVGDAATRAALWTQPALAALRRRAGNCDIALVSVGEVGAQATLFREGVLSQEDLASLRDAGAVGDVLCQFLDASGRLVDHPVNRRAMGLPLSELGRVPCVVLASGGARKAAALRAALAALPVAVLVTDAQAAAELLAD